MITAETLEMCRRLENALSQFGAPRAVEMAERIRIDCEPMVAPGGILARELALHAEAPRQTPTYDPSSLSRSSRAGPGPEGAWRARRGAVAWLQVVYGEADRLSREDGLAFSDRDLLAAALVLACRGHEAAEKEERGSQAKGSKVL